MGQSEPALMTMYLGEFVAMFLLMFFGDSACATANLGLGGMNLLAVLFGWFFGLIVAVYAMGGISGAHMNPAVTLYLWLSKKFPSKHVIPYIVMQILGAFVAALVIWVIYLPAWGVRDPNHTAAGIAATFYCFGWGGVLPAGQAWAEAWQVFVTEVVDTGILVFLAQAAGDDKNPMNLGKFTPFVIAGFIVGIGLANGPVSMICMNPARDLGPRLFCYLVGYGELAFPGPAGYEAYVFTIAPIVGALVGGFGYDLAFKPFYRR